jgi:Uma2 family endonuclease
MSTVHFDSYSPLVLHVSSAWSRMSADEFFEFCQLNPDLRMERAANGDLVIMTPTGGRSGRRSSKLNAKLSYWNEQCDLGDVFDSSTGFQLPSGAIRSPDTSWVIRSRWEQLTWNEQERILPIAPDFVAELRSPSDSLKVLHEKMAEYVANGVQLGWLIDPESKTVWVYQPGVEVRKLDQPESVSGDPVLPGFVLKMDAIWA